MKINNLKEFKNVNNIGTSRKELKYLKKRYSKYWFGKYLFQNGSLKKELILKDAKIANIRYKTK